ncbi:helix-turn-helix domain-containing protein [Chryseobacterium tructae]|uniref:Helix-turn-helix domain-containing protein n=1 Tax=Chryseobacterium tructae TaxID=1037380 RepID=A0ABV7XV37_9FLAO|nr:helix-turn-helix domain-containing protein [Chryseobacterium tructae]MDN3691774.1 helix-turn-helix domain-containing protein [Chryseobacterium tructae]
MKQHFQFHFYKICILFFCIPLVSAQDLNSYGVKSSYSDLEMKIEALEKNPSEQWKYITYFIKKAKQQKNLPQLNHAYLLASFSKKGEEQIKYVDSTVAVAKKIKDNNLIGDSYLSLGMAYASNENYPKALDSYLKGYSYIQREHNQYLINNAKYQIATVKNYMGSYDEADQLFEASVSFFRQNHEKVKGTDYKYYYLYALINYIDNNTHIHQLKKNIDLINEGKSFIKENKNFQQYYPYFISAEGVNQYFEKNYTASIAKLNEALKLYNDNWKHLTNKFYLGMSYWKLDQKEKALPYFLELDKDYDDTGKLDPFFRPAFENLILYYRETGDIEKQLDYVNKLILLDKVFEKDYQYLSSTLNKEYDTKRLIDEKSALEKKIKWQHYMYLSLLVLGAVIIIILIVLLKKYYDRKRYFKNLYEGFLKGKEQVEESLLQEIQIEKEEPYYNELDINPLTVEKILTALSQFEDEKQFLKKETTLPLLAKKCGTNTSYLSKIINHYKHANFAEYLNNLRLEYIVNQWKTKRKTRYMSIQDIASKAGYNSTQAFAKNFQERYRIPPSYFLNRLSEEENKNVLNN